jgi:hypothetical protein
MSFVVAATSLLAVVLVIALAREVRLRRALQHLLARLLDLWRNPHETVPPPDRDRRHPGRNP